MNYLDTITLFILKLLKKYYLIIIILFIGLLLRLYYYDKIPHHNWTADEYAYTWCGMGIIKNGIPSSWSWLNAYKEGNLIQWKNNPYRIVSPWFDHPPLFGLIAGITAILGGANSITDVELSVIRIPVIIMSVISILLIYLIIKKLFNNKAAVFSSLLYATHPDIVYHSHLVLAENFIILLSLLIIFLLIYYHEKQKFIFLLFIAIMIGMASLSKITGLFLLPLILLYLLYNKKWKESVYVSLISVFVFSLYFIYGAFYDFQLFLKVLTSLTQKYKQNFIIFYLVNNGVSPVGNYWLAATWIIMLFVVNDLKDEFQKQIIIFPIIVYSFTLFFMGAHNHFLSWYIMPFFPFSAMVLGIFFDKFENDSSFLKACIIFLSVFLWQFHKIINAFDKLMINRYQLFIIASVILLPYLLKYINSNKYFDLIQKSYTYVFIGILFALNIIMILCFPLYLP